MASATEEDSYDMCIIVESPDTPMTGWELWSGYENLSMAELNRRFKYCNMECRYGNMDIAEAAVKITDRIDQLTLLPKRNYIHYSTLKKWLKNFHTADDPVSLDTSSRSRKKRNSQSIVKTFRQREIMATAGPTHRLLPVECFKNMKFFEQRFSQDLCRVRHLLFDHPGKHIIVASSTNQVQIWNLATFQHENFIVHHGYDFHHIGHMELSADETLLTVGTDEGVLVVWDYKRRVELETEQICDSYFKHFKLLPEPINGNYCLVIMNREGEMTMWRIRYPKIDDGSKIIVRTYGPEPQMTPQSSDPPEPFEEAMRRSGQRIPATSCTFSVSSCGRYVARNTHDAKIRVYTHDQNFRLVRISNQALPHENINNIAWAHHSPRFVTSSWESNAMVWDAKFNMSLKLKTKEQNIRPGMAKAYWSAEDEWIITASFVCARIHVWDSVEGTIVHLIEAERAAPHPVLPQLLATIVLGEIKLWDLTRSDDQELHTFCFDNNFGPCDARKEVVWSPDGTLLVAPRWNGTLIMFNLSKGLPVIHAPTRVERLERRWHTSTANNIPTNINTSNNTSIANAPSA